MTKKSEQLATIEDTEFKVMKPESAEAMEAVNDNLRGAQLNRFDLVKIKVPGGGVLDWTIEDPEGTRLAPSFEGMILHWHDARAYYEDSDSQTDDPPDCASEDAITGDQFGSCVECQFSKWGSAVDKNGDPGKRQACRLKRVLYVLQKDSYLPSVLECPPTSYQSVKKYFISLSSQGISSAHIVTSFSLIGDQGSKGHKYAKIVFKKMRQLSDDEAAFAKSYGDTFKKSLQG